MKRIALAAMLVAVTSVTVMAQPVTVVSTRVLVDSCAYFPQLSADGSQLLYSNTEASVLYLKDLASGRVTTVADQGLPGFDARFAPDGKVYYVTQQLSKDNLVYRAAHVYDPATGRSHQVLKPQHGAVYVIATPKGVAIEGEYDSYVSTKDIGLYAYSRDSKLYLSDGTGVSVTSPAGECAGYLWASSTNTQIMFEAAGKGLYICDLQGNVKHRLPSASMPVWLDYNLIVAMTNTNFGAQKDKGTYLYVTTLGGNVQRLTEPEEHAVQPMVAGNKLVYVADGGQIKEATLQWENMDPKLLSEAAIVPRFDKKQYRQQTHIARRVFLNPGHGGHDSNDRPTPYYCYATNDTMAYYESDSNFKKGMALKQILESRGYEVGITRTENKTTDDLDLFEISSLANHSGADMFLAIHSNATGIERKLNFPLALYRGWSGEPCVENSDSIARCIMQHLIGNNATVWSHPLRIYGDWTFYPEWGPKTGLGVLRYNKLPGMLSEGSFHDYLPERRRLNNDDFCWLEGWNLSLAIDQYFGRSGATENGIVAGRIIDITGDSPYAGYKFGLDYFPARNNTTVTLLDNRKQVVAQATTDGHDNGFYLFRDVTPGIYHLQAGTMTRTVVVRPHASTYCNFSW